MILISHKIIFIDKLNLNVLVSSLHCVDCVDNPHFYILCAFNFDTSV